MPHTTPPRPRSRAVGWSLTLAVLVASLLALSACQDPAGPPPTLEAGSVSFSFSGRLNGSFVADGRCYRAEGYPAADSSCSLALDLGDTIRIRAVRDPRTLRWAHANVEFPEDGSCEAPGACRIALDYLTAVGALERSFRSTEATVTILETTEDRMQGTFSGRAHDPDGEAGDTIRIYDGAFDVPVER